MKELFISENDWDSHRQMLYVALDNTEGRVVEMGMGFGSTMPLDLACDSLRREFISIETNKEWFDKISSVPDFDWVGEHWLVGDYRTMKFGKRIGLLFVDAAPGEVRKEVIAKYADIADVIVVHDTEPGANYVYGMEDVLASFKYRKDYAPEGKPWTTAVSNVIDVSKWEI